MLKINAKAQNLCQNQASNFMPMLNQGSVNKEIDYPSKHFQNSCNWSKLKIIFFSTRHENIFVRLTRGVFLNAARDPVPFRDRGCLLSGAGLRFLILL